MSSPEPYKKRSSLPVFAGVLVLGLVLLGGGLALKQYFPAPEAEEPPVEEAVATGSEKAETSAMTETTVSADEVSDLKASYDDLAQQVGQLKTRIAQVPKSAPEPDLSPIQERLDQMAKSTEGLDDLNKKVDEMAGRLDAIGKTQGDLAAEIATVRELAKAVPSTPAVAEPAPTGGDDTALTDGIDLFKQGQYAKALDQFKEATEAHPDDARAWYFAAISSGFATNQWTGGETERFVKRGIEQEKAGEPARSEIDAAFTTLTPAQGKDWIAGYRRQAAGR